MIIVGYIAQLAFFLRFFVQYISSEKRGKSVTPPLFWKLSLFGNSGLLLYALSDAHFLVSLAQSQNAVLSWRNLNLLGPASKRVSLGAVSLTLITAAVCCTLYFALFCDSWSPRPDLSVGLHLLGVVGVVLFGLRFWVQWWLAETKQSGELTQAFWWISLVGACISSLYFFLISDWVNFVGPFVGLLPYSRNLYLMRKERAHVLGS